MSDNYTYLHGRFDSSYRLGRCPYCNRRPAFAWKASTGLRLDDGMRCPKCNTLLDRTSRDVHNLRGLTEDEVGEAYDYVLKNLAERHERNRARLLEWRGDLNADKMVREMNIDSYRSAANASEKNLKRVRKGYDKWLASDPSSATDEHDMAVKSGWQV